MLADDVWTSIDLWIKPLEKAFPFLSVSKPVQISNANFLSWCAVTVCLDKVLDLLVVCLSESFLQFSIIEIETQWIVTRKVLR
ncbi:hypothetical protein BOV91_12295 [Solemya velum gill symbiont]|nr:hypothetical protein BOV91_12295 [Solemya velum gill symbiont]